MNQNSIDDHRHTVSTASGDISYIDVGEGPVALLVHGVATSSLLWREVISKLAGERRCIAFDLPLHGHSPAAADQDFSLAGLAKLLAAFCEALGLREIDLVANDTGCAIAQIFAASNPGLLHTVTFTNGDTEHTIPPAEFKPTIELAASGALAETGPALLADLAGARAIAFAPGLQDAESCSLELTGEFLRPVLGTVEHARQFSAFLLELIPRDLAAARPALAELTVPTLLVWGDADTFFGMDAARELLDLIPGAKDIVELAGAKLFFPLERSDELVAALREHWRSA